MTHKTIHVNQLAIDAVETYHDENGQVKSRVVHMQGNDIDGQPRKFTTAEGQYCDPSIMDGLIALRGDLLEEINQ